MSFRYNFNRYFADYIRRPQSLFFIRYLSLSTAKNKEILLISRYYALAISQNHVFFIFSGWCFIWITCWKEGRKMIFQLSSRVLAIGIFYNFFALFCVSIWTFGVILNYPSSMKWVLPENLLIFFFFIMLEFFFDFSYLVVLQNILIFWSMLI